MTEKSPRSLELIRDLSPVFASDPETARSRLLEAAELARRQGDVFSEFTLLDELAWQATTKFEAEEALNSIQRVLDLAERTGDLNHIGAAHNTYGVFFMNVGEPLPAVEQLGKALAAYETADSTERVASVLVNIGELLVEMDEMEKAAPYLEEACKLTETSGRPDVLLNLAFVRVLQERVPDAWHCLVRVWREGRLDADWPLRANVHDVAGWIRHRTGNLAAALRHYRKAVALFQQQHDSFRTAAACLSIGDIHLEQEEMLKAAEAYRQSAEISGIQGYRSIEIRSLRKLLPLTTGPVESLAIQQRLSYALREADERNKALRRNFVGIQIRLDHLRREREEMKRDYELDALTGLLAYRNLDERLKRLADNCTRFAFLFLDVDRLKQLNDRWGHAAGDMLLRSFANDLADALPRTGIAIRKSGDEFIVVLPHAGRSETCEYLEDLFARLGIQRRIGEEAMALSCSAGIALWPTDTTNVGQLEWMADQAMYQAKDKGRNRFCWHQSFQQS